MQLPYFRLLLACILFVISSSSCKRNLTKKPVSAAEYYLNQDISNDSIYPAAEEELQINSGGSKIYGLEYIANGGQLHPTVVLLHGLPGNERNLDLAQNLRRAGYNVFYFDYRGTWGSQGEFSFANALNDANAVLRYITDPVNRTRLRVDTNRIALVGHSMGAGMALIEGLNNPRVKAVAGISVFNPFTILQGEEAPGNIVALKDYLTTLGMLNCNPESFLKELLANINHYNIEEKVAQASKPILVIDEHQNNDYFSRYSKNKNFDYKIWNTDHAFTNKRIALSRELKSWLDQNLLKLKYYPSAPPAHASN